MRKLLFQLALILVSGTAWAQSEGLVMRFDFTKVSGTQVADAVGGVHATLQNGATVEPMGRYRVLSLGAGNGWLDLSQAAGTVFAASDNYSVSVFYRVESETDIAGAGNFVWSFSTSSACEQHAGKYSAYRINAQRYATSTGGYAHETGIERGVNSDKGRWVSVVYTENNGTGTLYIDGSQVGTVAGMPRNSTNYASAKPTFNWLGRSPFTADVYLRNTLIADFRLYNRALSAAEVSRLSAETDALDEQFLHGTPGDATQLRQTMAEAEALLADPDGYLPGAVADLRDALNMSRGYLDGFSQSAIDRQRDDLLAAIDALKSTRGITFVPAGGLIGAYDTDRGFVHPGGLHTQADFDRIKQLVEERNSKVLQALEVLRNAEYAQPTVATWPVETIIRGEGAQNYINAARGATMAYQNALRWKIDGNKDCARAAVRILLQWANVTKGIGGNSNYALAAGLYGYEFAQAAELVRDQFTATEMETMRNWFMQVWYPSAIGFLRGRNGTWENAANKPAAGWGDAGNRPGHYWSNWGLCNTLCVMSIGVFCDDVFVYNQGLSYFKYDQVGTFAEPRTANPILNDGLTEYLGNLVVTTAKTPDSLEASGYGLMGQMQESGRDVGHANMALGLAVDIAHMGWNQGDDLFSYMNHRLAAGTEFMAAVNCGVSGEPWTNYKYCDCRTAWHGGWFMEGPATGSEIRPYWGTIIGHYEGVKGVRMPYSEQCLQKMGVDGGGTGSTSGGYDHLGYSVLMNTRSPQLCPANEVPTELSPLMVYEGDSIAHNELGGLKNTFVVDVNTALPKGRKVELIPQLPAGEEDTGLWSWNTGATTRKITVTTDRSYVYRATYTNRNGVKSQQCFSLAVAGDCRRASKVTVSAAANGENLGADSVSVFYGSPLTLTASTYEGWGEFVWDNGKKGGSVTTQPVTHERDFQVNFTNQGGAVSSGSIHVGLLYQRPQIIVNGQVKADTMSVIVNPGDRVVVGPYVPDALPGVTYDWSDGSHGRTIVIDSVTASGLYDLTFTVNGETVTQHYSVLVCDTMDAVIAPGTYLLRRVCDGMLLTNNRSDEANYAQVSFSAAADGLVSPAQVWTIAPASNSGYDLVSAKDSFHLSNFLFMRNRAETNGLCFRNAIGVNRYAIHNRQGYYWEIDSEGKVSISTTLTRPYEFGIELVPYTGTTVGGVQAQGHNAAGKPFYNLSGQRVGASYRGVVVSGGKKFVKK